jgi:DNA-binding HxlR family transcriptional regulator
MIIAKPLLSWVPPRVEYSLTPIAKDFLREISYVIEWGQLHFEQIVKGRK